MEYISNIQLDNKTIWIKDKKLWDAMPISVKEYGAVGDGVTNDAPAFNTWLDYIASNNKIGYIPNGVYNIASVITYRKNGNIMIIGEDRNNTVIHANGTSISCFDFRNCNVRFLENFSINCNGFKNQTSGHAINMVDCNQIDDFSCYIRNITISNVAYSAIQIYNTSGSTLTYNVNIIDVNVYGLGKTYNTDNIHPSGIILENCFNAIVQRVECANVRSYPIELKDKCYGCQISNCFIWGCEDGIFLGGDRNAPQIPIAGYVAHSLISNVICRDCDSPLYIGSGLDIVVNNFLCEKPGANFKRAIEVQYSNNISITGSFTFSGEVLRAGNNGSGLSVKGNMNALATPTAPFNISNVARTIVIVEGCNFLINDSMVPAGINLANLIAAKWYGTAWS